MALRASSFAVSANVLLLVACGGSPDSGLFGSSGGAIGGGGIGTSSGGVLGAGGATPGTGGTGGGGGAVSGGGPGAGGGSGMGGSWDAGTGGSSAGGAPGGGGETSAGGSVVPDASVDAGAGGTSPADGGTGGVFGDGGAGGNAAAGGAGAGGAGAGGAGAGGADAGVNPPQPTDGLVRCGTETCDLEAGQVCCTTAGGPAGPRSVCTSNTTNCSRVFACDNHGDCGVGEQCCLTYGAVSLSPSSRCQPTGCDIPVECGSAADCARGETCCGLGTTVTGGTIYSAIACQVGTCNGDGDYTLCHGGVSCPDGTSCEASSHFPPGYPVCK